MGENGGKWGKMGKNGGKWRKMGENGKLLQIHHGKCMKLFQQERKMEENGVEMGGKWVKNGTRAGPIFPIFPKGNLLPHRAVNKKPSIQVSGWKNGENGGIRKTGYFLGLRADKPRVCVALLCVNATQLGPLAAHRLPAAGVAVRRVPYVLLRDSALARAERRRARGQSNKNNLIC